MKKFIFVLVLAMCVLFVPNTAYALGKSVTITDTDVSTSSVSVSGTTDAIAVMVQIRDEDDNILAMQSFAVASGKFNGTIDSGLDISCAKSYKVYVADYEGGDWAIEDLKLEHSYSSFKDNADGKTHSKKCSVCGDVVTANHSFSTPVYNNDASCTKDGTKTSTCSVCGAKDTVADADHKATGHTDADPDGKCDSCGENLGGDTTPDTTPSSDPKDPTVTPPSNDTGNITAKGPSTGDKINFTLVFGLMIFSATGVVVLLKRRVTSRK